MAIFAVHYTYTEATLAGRDEHRPAHREWLRAGVDQGVVLSTGAYPDGSGALILVTADDLAGAQKLMADDPFAVRNIVDTVRIVHWTPIMGAFSE